MTETQHSYVISHHVARPVGIVHEVSRALSEINGNIADIRQSVLCGYFTMILLASFPEKVTRAMWNASWQRSMRAATQPSM
jgi:glycine cleavage system transcriptional repressor